MPKTTHTKILQPDFKELDAAQSRRKNFQNTEAMQKARMRNLEKAHRVKDDKSPRMLKSMSNKAYKEQCLARYFYSFLPNPEEAMLYYNARKENTRLLSMIRKMRRDRAKAEKVPNKAT